MAIFAKSKEPAAAPVTGPVSPLPNINIEVYLSDARSRLFDLEHELPALELARRRAEAEERRLRTELEELEAQQLLGDVSIADLEVAQQNLERAKAEAETAQKALRPYTRAVGRARELLEARKAEVSAEALAQFRPHYTQRLRVAIKALKQARAACGSALAVRQVLVRNHIEVPHSWPVPPPFNAAYWLENIEKSGWLDEDAGPDRAA